MNIDMFFSMTQDDPTSDILLHLFIDILYENCTFVLLQNLGKVELSMRALHAISNWHIIYEMGRKLCLQKIHSRVSNAMQIALALFLCKIKACLAASNYIIIMSLEMKSWSVCLASIDFMHMLNEPQAEVNDCDPRSQTQIRI